MIYSYFQSPEVAVCVSSAVTREVHFVKESLIMTKMGEQEITVCLAQVCVLQNKLQIFHSTLKLGGFKLGPGDPLRGHQMGITGSNSSYYFF